MTVDDQIRQGWKDYYAAIGAGHTEEAVRIFDRVSALAFAQTARKTTSKMTAVAVESSNRVLGQ